MNDPDNRFAAINGGATATYTYDYQGRRTSKTVAGVTTKYLYDGVESRLGDDGRGNNEVRVWPEHRRATGRDTPREPSVYLNADGMGSIVATNNVRRNRDSQLGLRRLGRQRRARRGRGRIRSRTQGERSGEAGLHFYRARHYQPSTGRFVGPDPTGFAGGINLYGYALNASIDYVDPFGLDAWRKTNSWGPKFIQAYSDFMKAFVRSYSAKIDCADLALLGLITFASDNGLPVSLRYYSRGGWNVYDAQSSQFQTVDQFISTVLANLGALNVIDNTHPINAADLAPGDLMMSKWSATLGHTRVVTEVSGSGDDIVVTWYQGNLPPNSRPDARGNFRTSTVASSFRTRFLGGGILISGSACGAWLPLAAALLSASSAGAANADSSGSRPQIVRFDDRNERVFATGQPAQFQSQQRSVAYLTSINDTIKTERPKWSRDWTVSVFEDAKLAGHKDDMPPSALKDGSWVRSYIAEYTARDGKLVIFPLDPKRMKTRVVRLDTPSKK